MGPRRCTCEVGKASALLLKRQRFFALQQELKGLNPAQDLCVFSTCLCDPRPLNPWPEVAKRA
jgi:hypothetical protein